MTRNAQGIGKPTPPFTPHTYTTFYIASRVLCDVWVVPVCELGHWRHHVGVRGVGGGVRGVCA